MAKAPLKYQLINPVKIRTEKPDLDFPAAQSMADEKVKSLFPDPMLISWYNATTGESHPKVESGGAGKRGWLNYAQSRNCDMTVDINDEQFVFIYLTQP
ncbi:AF1514 family protein [Desulfosarcina sp.]|uniref:AF1514 family protein n=1 Tax=Desulfosarcina sp. TaxID=2027861 RepID=UPI0029A9BF82|nr:AF1514 family protein [Desulfosarcina sp.]MDX2455056.1 AF1514 family protein [Desulfosarcina sp.]MDX2492627.1 AF1514 family protein [Desulfosarcina sp.]